MFHMNSGESFCQKFSRSHLQDMMIPHFDPREILSHRQARILNRLPGCLCKTQNFECLWATTPIETNQKHDRIGFLIIHYNEISKETDAMVEARISFQTSFKFGNLKRNLYFEYLQDWINEVAGKFSNLGNRAWIIIFDYVFQSCPSQSGIF